MKKWLAILLCAVMVLSCFACGKKDAAEEEEADYSFADGDQYDQIGGELNVLNWGEYLDPELISLFEAETGVKVNYTEMTGNEEMLVKLRGADNPYDMCFPSDYTIEKLIKDDLLMPLDMSKIPNSKNIAERMFEVTNTFDPGNKYSLPYMWGTLGILYNTKMVDEAVDSWDILWNEKYAGKIWQYYSIRDAMAVSLLRLGYDINTTDPNEINKAKDELIKQIPLLKGLGTDNIRASMINGKAALAVIYAGDAILCMEENEDLAYVIPKEGSNVWFDNVVIPKTAKNVEAAYAFIAENNIIFSIAFGPVLVENGELQVCDWYPAGEIDKGYSRAGIGQKDHLHYFYMSLNHSAEQAARWTVNQFGERMYQRGLQQAYCLDGGQTSEIVWRGSPYNYIDFGGEREVSDIIYFATAIPESEGTP